MLIEKEVKQFFRSASFHDFHCRGRGDVGDGQGDGERAAGLVVGYALGLTAVDLDLAGLLGRRDDEAVVLAGSVAGDAAPSLDGDEG